MKREIRDGLCGICPAGCWVRVTIEDGRLVDIEPQPDHPLGMICTIGRNAPQIVHDPDRIKTPLKRRGPKGSLEFDPITWDEAYETIRERFELLKSDYGPEVTAIYTGRGSFDMAMCDLLQPAEAAVSSASNILFPFGSPNTLGVGALCYVSFAMIAPHVTMGEMLITMDTDIDQSELVVLWGANPATDSPPSLHHRIVRARERGAEVIAIDPRRTATARETDAEWVGIRPGTDGALALGLINVLIEEELYDEAFVRDWTVGFDGLSQMTQHYRPEVVESITGVPAGTVVDLARRLAGARGASPVMYTGLEYSDSGVQAIRAVFVLWALAGQLDVPGGLIFQMKENQFPQNRVHLISNPDPRKAPGRDRFPIYSEYRGESHAIALPDSVLRGDPYRIRAVIILGGSIITSWPEPKVWRETLGALDFLVTVDRYLTADAAYADIVLPATTMFEITSFMRYGPLFKIRERLLDPVGEARNDFLILTELTEHLGYGHLYPQSEEEILERALEGTPFTVDEVREAGGSVQVPTVMMEYRKWEKGRLRRDGKPGFDTPSGKFEIASSILAEHGYDPLPVYTEPAEGPLADPDLADHYPLVLNTGGRTPFDFRSQHHGVSGLRERHPEPTVSMNHLDAADRGIDEGDLVEVSSPRGRVRYRALVTENMVRGAVDASQGGGGPLGPQAWRECNVNDLTDLHRHDPISGFPVYKALLCEVERVGDESGAPLSSVGEYDDLEPAGKIAGEGTVQMDPPPLIYLDHNATTAIHPEVLEAMLPALAEDSWGNPSSIYQKGSQVKAAIEDARRRVAQLMGCTARRITFTGSGSEANNLAIKGVALAAPRGRHIITSTIEHPAVLKTCRALEAAGFEITILPVDGDGLVDVESFRDSLRPDTTLTSIMYANNEVGTIQPVAELAAIGREAGVPFHTDTVQALGKIPLDVESLGVDMASVSAHKVQGPKGVGALYIRNGIELSPLVHGGGQERGMRAGTENVAGIIGFGKACELAQRRLYTGVMDEVEGMRDRLEEGIRKLVPGAVRNGSTTSCLPNTVNLTLPGIRGESLVLALDPLGVFFSSGSACKSGDPDPSHVLLAIGLSEDDAHCSVRFSLGPDLTVDDIELALKRFERILTDTFSAVRFVGCR
ncbi:aminotransferase class V-fold PLP-dependent enzyme [Candidatus Zixiibacteriota bacterium]